MSLVSRQIRWFLQVTALVVAGLASFASQADAACGDYVLTAAEHAALPMMPVHVPCHGPKCSSRDTLPVIPVVPPNVQIPQDWLIHGLLTDGSRAEDIFRALEDANRLRPSHTPGRIFRPPRLA